MVRRFDGIDLWGEDGGRGYSGIAPITEWQRILAGRIAISYHANGMQTVVLDAERRVYEDMGVHRDFFPIGANVGELLDWLWKSGGRPPSAGGPQS